jgi:hypothetical protein
MNYLMIANCSLADDVFQIFRTQKIRERIGVGISIDEFIGGLEVYILE